MLGDIVSTPVIIILAVAAVIIFYFLRKRIIKALLSLALIAAIIFILMTSVNASGADVEFSSASFDSVHPSFSDVVVVGNNGKLGAVDLYGNTVVPFDEWAAVLPDRNGNTAFISASNSGIVSHIFDSTGKEILTLNNRLVTALSEGRATVLQSTGNATETGMLYNVEYIDIASGKVLQRYTDVLKATPFSEGYAAIQGKDSTFIVDLDGKVVFRDDKRLMPLAACGDGLIPFSAEDEDYYTSFYIVDIKNKKRICMTDFQLDSETNFEKVMSTIKNFSSFYPITNEDNVKVFSYNGMYICVTENPVNYSVDYIPFINGVRGDTVDIISDYNTGEKYFFSDEGVFPFYVSLNGKTRYDKYEGVTAFSNGRAVVFGEDSKFFFVDEEFNEISEHFGDVFWVKSFGDVVCAIDSNKYRIVRLSTDSAPSKPSVPSTPSKPSGPEVSTGMKNFVKTQSYNDGVFPDVKASDWFRKNVALAYETGLMNGKENGFAPQDKLTLAQVITMAARLHSVYNTGKADFVQGKVWYEVYVDYCINHGIISKNEFTGYNRNATRAEFVRILSKSIPAAEFEKKNIVNSIPDVDTRHRDAAPIFLFYRAGILAGSDSAHSFFPNSDITRAETAAIITRIIDKSLRLDF